MSPIFRTPARPPTGFPDLNRVLDEFIDGVTERLGAKLVGIYLQGSFAVGDADARSDCDFLVALAEDLASSEIADLDDLHRAIHRLPILPWRHRLEGSYAPVDVLRRWSLTPRDPPGAVPRPADWRDPGLSGCGPRVYPFAYLSHGARTLVRSEHDNTEVVRWSLREKGIVLTGPDPREFVDPVSAAALRAEMRRTMDLCLAVDLRPLDKLRHQAFWVGLFCRMLHTSVTGIVASKNTALAWAAMTVNPQWRGLIERSRTLRLNETGMAEGTIGRDEAIETRRFADFVSGALYRSFADPHATNSDVPIHTVHRGRPRPGDLELPNDVRLKAMARGAEGVAWLHGLEDLVVDVARRWNLAIGSSYRGGSEALVVEAQTAEGRDAVLKLAIPGLDPQAGELRVLLAAAGRGYAEVLAHDRECGAMLLDRLGPQLGTLGLSIDAQIAALCATVREAWTAPPAGAGFPNGRDKATGMARFIEDTWLALQEPCSRRTVDVALAFAAERANAFDPATAVLAHGDAHPGNTLLAGDWDLRRFKFIDPDGLVIEPAYDLGISMRGWSEELLAGDPVDLGRRRCTLIAELSRFDARAIWQWGFIERVGTGLLLQQIGLAERARDFLVVADAWAAADLPWRADR